jgi:hypothetical protein
MRVLSNGGGSTQFHRDFQRALKETKRQLDKKRAGYEKLREERRARVEEFRRDEARLTTLPASLG